MNLIEEFAKRLTASETVACQCDYCKRTREDLIDMLDEVHKKLLDTFFYGGSAYAKEMRSKLKIVFAEMRGE